MATLWSDDFESGAAIGVNYPAAYDCETASDAGRSGWGVRPIPALPAADQYGCAFRYVLNPDPESVEFMVTVDLDHSAYAGGSWANSIIAVNDVVGAHAWLLRDPDTNDAILGYMDGSSWPTWTELEAGRAEGILTTDAWHTYVLCGHKSSWVGGVCQSDGWLSAYIDGVRIIHATGLQFDDAHGASNKDDTHSFVSVDVYPAGHADNFIIYDTAIATATWTDIAEYCNVPIAASAFPGGVARVLCYLWSATGDAMLARLYDATNGVSVGESASISSTTPALADFAVTLTGASSTYRLQVTGPVGVDLFCSPAVLRV